MLPTALSSEPLRSDTLSLSDEFSWTADTIICPRASEMLSSIAGYYCLGGQKSYKVLSGERPGSLRATRKFLGPRSPPLELRDKKQTSSQEVDITAAAKANKAIWGVGEISRPRKEAANLSPETLSEGRTAFPPCAPFVAPNLSEALCVARDPIRR